MYSPAQFTSMASTIEYLQGVILHTAPVGFPAPGQAHAEPLPCNSMFILEAYSVFFENGAVNLSVEEPISEDHLMLIKRFGEVFGYAHSRYKELQEKEAQNQELKNQNVLERLRGQAQGMQSSEDIGPVAEAVFKELKDRGLQLLHTSIRVVRCEINTSASIHRNWSSRSSNRVASSPVAFSWRSGRISKALRRCCSAAGIRSDCDSMRERAR